MELLSGVPMPKLRTRGREHGFWKTKAAEMGVGQCYLVTGTSEAIALRNAMVALYGKGCAARRRKDEAGSFYVWRLK
jgi:hypothetical protein